MTFINPKSVKLVNTAKEFYKEQIILCDKFMQMNHGEGYDDFWNMVFDLDTPQVRKTKRRANDKR